VKDRTSQPLFIAAIGLSAFTLFALELLAGRLVLPIFGGTPSVWTTALCFFTAVVFGGYAYAHWIATRLGQRVGGAVHVVLAAIVAAMAIGLAMDFGGLDPIRGLYFAAILNGLAAPPLILVMMLLSNDERTVGRWLSGSWSNALVGLAFVAMVAAPIAYLLA